MPRIRWTPEENRRLLDLLAAGKSWTLISVALKRSMVSVKLQAKRLLAARDRPRGRQLVTLEDAGKYITKLPKAEHEAQECGE